MNTEFEINSLHYRVKKMNAIEMLAIQSQISFDSADESYACYSQILERCEVQCNDKWLPVKEKGKEIYYPAGLEDDLETVQIIIKHFINWLKDVFTKSNESNSKTE